MWNLIYSDELSGVIYYPKGNSQNRKPTSKVPTQKEVVSLPLVTLSLKSACGCCLKGKHMT